jgi:GNAT superfamily N-acetyltransferase
MSPLDERLLNRFQVPGDVRWANAEDWPAVAVLYADCLAEEGLDMPVQRRIALAQWVQNYAKTPQQVLVMERDGQIAAQIFVVFEDASPWEPLPVISTYGMYVRPDQRTPGTPLPLFRACVELAKARGACIRFMESTVSKNKIGYFERLGFRPVGVVYEGKID